MSDDDIEMVDVIESPSDSGDVSNSNDSPQSASPNEGDNSELDAATRVDSLCALDEKVVSIMAKGAAIVGAISEGKLAGDAEAKRERFKQTITACANGVCANGVCVMVCTCAYMKYIT